ncbi:MAG: type II secretion system protein [Candidatus Sumerlaeaceae bacterium]
MRHREACSAFTLVEILITVGIIAILAVIAIPNLLLAQTRAKVTRVKADLAAVVVALELYHTDRNAYPTYHYANNQEANGGTSFHAGGSVLDLGVSPEFDGRNPLTTPVAYLTAMPTDPFNTRSPDESPEVSQYYYVNWDYAIERIPSPDNDAFLKLRKLQGPWRLHSNGPDRTGPDSDVLEGQVIYSPANGTISRGDIVRTQKLGQQ